MSGDFVGRVSRAMLVTLAIMAGCAALLAGWPGVVGIVAGGLVSLGSFRWIASGVGRLVASGARGGLGLSTVAVGARHLALFGALALVLASGAAHPLALCAGLSALPPLLIAFAVVDARVTG